jgi:hypothetical protein
MLSFELEDSNENPRLSRRCVLDRMVCAADIAIKLIVRAHHLKEKLRASPETRIADLAMQEKLSPSYVARLLRLTLLAPDITRAILEGRQPAGFTAQKLVTYVALPFAWPEQRQALGFI